MAFLYSACVGKFVKKSANILEKGFISIPMNFLVSSKIDITFELPKKGSNTVSPWVVNVSIKYS